AALLAADYAGLRYGQTAGSLSWHGIWGARAASWPQGHHLVSDVLADRVTTASGTVVVTRVGPGTAILEPERVVPDYLVEGGRVATYSPLVIRGRKCGEVMLGWRHVITVPPA